MRSAVFSDHLLGKEDLFNLQLEQARNLEGRRRA
jgi:hypothetical protein